MPQERKRTSLWEKFKKSTPVQDYLSPAWDTFTTPIAGEIDTRYDKFDKLVNDLVIPNTSVLGGAAAAIGLGPAKRALKYAGKGINNPTVLKPKPGTNPSAFKTLHDESKQIAMTWGLPGTGLNSHSLALAGAHLKSTPLKELPKEAYETTRMLWNPERAVKKNKELYGGISPARKREDFTKNYAGLPLPKYMIRNLVESDLDHFAKTDPKASASRFKDILDLERPKTLGGPKNPDMFGGMKTADVLMGGNAFDTGRQILTKPLTVKGKNVNPLPVVQEMFDTPTFGEDYLNTYFKRKTALSEVDRARGLNAKSPIKQGADLATNTMGGFDKGDKSVFNNDILRFALTAPDWTRRHFALGKKKLDSVLPKNWSNQELAPYRRYLGYDAAGLGLTAGANYALNDQMPERSTDVFNIELPKDPKVKKRDVLSPTSTEMDLPKTAWEIANNLGPWATEKKDLDSIYAPVRHRIHPWTRSFLDPINNFDWKGNRLTNKEVFSKPKTDMFGNTTFEQKDIGQKEALGNVLSNFGANITPQFAETLMTLMESDKGNKKLSGPALFSQLFELPIRSYTPEYSQTITPFDRKMRNMERKWKPKF